MTSPDPKPPVHRLLLSVAGWVLAWSPAVMVLAMLFPLRVPIPFEDSWAYVEQYRDWWQGNYGWRELLAPHNNHPTAFGKLLYFVALHGLDGNVGALPLVAWVCSLAIAVSIWAMARPLWSGCPALGMMLMFSANLTVFTAAQGHAWVWDFLFENFIPGAALCVAMAVLLKFPRSWLALAAAALLSIAGMFSFGTGFLAGLLLTPIVAMHFPEKSLPWRGVVCACWLMLMGGMTLFALTGMGEATNTGDESRIGSLMEQPFLVAQFILVLLGYLLGNGTTLEPGVLCALMGLGLVSLLLVCLLRVWQLRREPGLFRAVLPWLLVMLFGLGNALLITYGRLRASLIPALVPRYVTFTLFLTLGVLLLAGTVALRDKPAGWFRIFARRAGLLLLGAFVAMHALNWNHGWQHMKWEHERMKQDRAMLSFAKVLPLDPEVMWQNLDGKDRTTRLALFLEEHGRLQGVRMAPGTEISIFRRGSPLPDKWAWLDEPQLLGDVMHLRGACGVSKDMISLPELVLITAQVEGEPENIVSFATPRMPFDFHENEWRRRLHVDHYFGWERKLPLARFPKGHVTIRAYGYWNKGKSVRALNHAHVLQL